MRKNGIVRTWFFIVMAVVFMTSATACDAAGKKSQKDPVQARKELGAMNIQYSNEAFANAAKDGDKLAVELFLDAGMNVDAKSNSPRALEYASQYGQTEIVKLLLDKGADVKGDAGGRALQGASRNGHTEIVQLLKAAGAK
jgi:ankyrin repeat protein